MWAGGYSLEMVSRALDSRRSQKAQSSYIILKTLGVISPSTG